jgi:hypothetical protein
VAWGRYRSALFGDRVVLRLRKHAGGRLSRREIAGLVSVILLLLVPLYSATASWDTIQSNDPRSAALAGWTWVTTGDLTFDHRWPPEATSWGMEGRDGALYSNRFPGIIAVAAVGYSIPVMSGLVGSDAAHPYLVPLWPATITAVLIAALAVGLTYVLFRHLPVPSSQAALGAFFVALGTPVWSVSADALWTHGLTHALLIGTVLASTRGRSGLAAVLAASVVTVRPHLFAAVVVLAAIERTWARRGLLVAGGVIGLGILAAYSLYVFGQPLPAAGYRVEGLVEHMPASSPRLMVRNVKNWLIEPGRGVLIFVPMAALAMPRIASAWRSSPPWVRYAALAGIAYSFSQLGLIRASGGTFFFGHRTTIEGFVLAAPLLFTGIGHLWREGPIARTVIALVGAYSIALHGYGAAIGMSPEAQEILREYQQETGPGAAVSRGYTI